MIISACIITYNQEDYIAQCLDGALSQIVNFEYEIVIGEDKSTDGTLEICKKYADKYPNKIRLIEREYNLGMTGNWLNTMASCSGKYIAICEGDDYWTDPLKLQKQVDFMEENSDFGLVYTDAKIYNQEYEILHTKTFNYYYKEKPHSDNYFHYLLKQNSIQTLTVLCRKDFLMNALENLKDVIGNFKMGDYPLWIEIARLSKIKYLDYVTAVYRKSSNTASSHGDVEKRYEFLQSSFDIQFYFCEKYNLIEVKKKLIIKYNRFQCYQAFDLNHYEIDKEILRIFLTDSFKDKLIKFSFNSHFNNLVVRIIFGLEKKYGQIINELKIRVIRVYYKII
jgi:glycosyltransferase involved in cell wall biosynthesis